MRGLQQASLILPITYAAGTATLTATETVADALEHTSIDIWTEQLRDKTVHILAIEAVGAGIPGPLNVWVEVSPYPRANYVFWAAPLPISNTTWAAIGGGGGAIPPVAPTVENGTGVNLTAHNFLIPWQLHSPWARIVVQTPVVVATAYWIVQVYFEGKTGG